MADLSKMSNEELLALYKQQSVGPKAAPEWGPGALRQPDGSVVRYGPKGGVTTLKKAPTDGSNGGMVDTTEGNNKAFLQGGLMSEAERQYRQALTMGYDPGDPMTAAANYIEDAPLIGGFFSGAASFLRPDEADLGRKAERAWNEAMTKAMTGAGQSKGEEIGGPKIYFPRAGEGPQTRQSSERIRQQAFEGVRGAAGPRANDLPVYPGAKGSSPDKPFNLAAGQSRRTIPKMAYYRDPEGNIRLNENSDDGNPIVIPAKQAPAAGASGAAKRGRYNPQTGEIE